MATGRDMNLVIGQKLNATIGGDMQERIQGLCTSVAKIGQRLQAPKTWLGSEDVNVLQLLGKLIYVVEQMNTAIAAHKHGPHKVTFPNQGRCLARYSLRPLLPKTRCCQWFY